MRLKYRIKNILQFIAFAFYPKSTMIACTACSIVGIIVLAIAMMMVPSDSRLYNVIFALTTGVTGSFFVSIVVELSGNYRNNKLAWQELQDYYSIVDEYETMKQVYMENTPSQRAEKKARNEFVDSIFKSDVGTELTDEIMEELKNIAEEHPKDIIESTWEQLPKIIPVLRRTFDEKKAFLNDDEIFALSIIIDNYLQIRHEVMELLQMSPMLCDIFNSPDQEFLNYPQNILENLPKWMKKCLATNEGQNAMERLTDSVMSDQFMLSYFMNDYEISIRGLDEYHSVLGDESD